MGAQTERTVWVVFVGFGESENPACFCGYVFVRVLLGFFSVAVESPVQEAGVPSCV